jgi:hypothetical protein
MTILADAFTLTHDSLLVTMALVFHIAACVKYLNTPRKKEPTDAGKTEQDS